MVSSGFILSEFICRRKPFCGPPGSFAEFGYTYLPHYNIISLQSELKIN